VVTLYAGCDTSFDSCGIEATNAAVGVTPAQTIAPPAAAIPVDTDNLPANGDFNNGAANWLTCGGEFDIEAQGINNCDAVVLGKTACVFQEFAAAAGIEYGLSYSAMATGFASLTLSHSDVSFSVLASRESAVTSSTFNAVTAFETTPDDTAQGAVTLYADNSAVCDNCTMIEL